MKRRLLCSSRATKVRTIGLLVVCLAAPGLATPALAGMGVWTRDLTRGERARLPSGEPLGTMIGAVYPGSPAAEVGLQAGDRIVGAAGFGIASTAAFARALGTLERHETVPLEISRRERRFRVDVPRVDDLLYLGVACDAGEGLACKDLADNYRAGSGVPRDPKKAASLLREGCRLGAAHACTMLASRVANGLDGRADPAGGLRLWDWACRHHDGEACRSLAEKHGLGALGLPRSRERRREYHARGCEEGNRSSCNELGKALEDGDGGPQDPARAAEAYEAGCARDSLEACVWLGWLYVKGKGVAVDGKRGLELFEHSCAGGFSRGCSSQAQTLLKRGDGQPALAILMDTCVQGHQEACCLTAQVHQKGLGGVPPDVARAARIYESLCQEGHAHACHDLAFLYRAGNAYMAGRGLEEDEPRALQLYEEGCTLDHKESCRQAGLLLVQGDGPRDLKRGRALLKKACDVGLEDSCDWVRRLAEEERVRRLEPVWARRRARGEMAPGRMRYSGEIRVQGQTHPAALTTTIWDDGEAWVVEEDWALPGGSTFEINTLERETLFLARHSLWSGDFARHELEVEDGWVIGWSGHQDSPDPRDQIVIDAPDPILAWGAGTPQVLATFPLAVGYERSFWGIQSGFQRVLPRRLKVVAVETIEVPAGTFAAWKVVLRQEHPEYLVLTLWIDTESRRVLRYDGSTGGGRASWTVTLER